MNRYGLLTLVAVAVFPQVASAYVREVTKSGVPVAWRYPCVTMRLFVGNPPSVLGSDDYLAAATQAAATWSQPQVACTNLSLRVTPEPGPTANAGYDGQNVIVFRAQTWCREPTPINDAGVPQPDCYPASALAVTTVTKNSNTGEILDTDIEFNAVNYAWGDLEGHPDLLDGPTADFQNALTHELGHVIGLDHNCYVAADGQPRLADNTGAPEVDCYGTPNLSSGIAQATMYPSVVLSDTQRRVLSPDDILGACDIYPATGNDACPAIGGGGCSVESGRAGSVGYSITAFAVTLAAALTLWRRRLI